MVHRVIEEVYPHIIEMLDEMCTYLQALHYRASTNLALIQSSMTYLYEKHGPEYHWILDLFQRMGLPILVV